MDNSVISKYIKNLQLVEIKSNDFNWKIKLILTTSLFHLNGKIKLNILSSFTARISITARRRSTISLKQTVVCCLEIDGSNLEEQEFSEEEQKLDYIFFYINNPFLTFAPKII